MMNLIHFCNLVTLNREKMQFLSNRSILGTYGTRQTVFCGAKRRLTEIVREKLSDTSGISRDLSFEGIMNFNAFLEFLALFLLVLECFLKSENFCLNWGTLAQSKKVRFLGMFTFRMAFYDGSWL